MWWLQIHSFICYFSFREAKKNVEALANSPENTQTCSLQAAESLEVEAKSPADDHPFPEPRLPYPFTSCLTEKEQKTYLYLMTKFSKRRNHFQVNAASQREYFAYVVRDKHMTITKGVIWFFFLTKHKRKGKNWFSVQFVIEFMVLWKVIKVWSIQGNLFNRNWKSIWLFHWNGGLWLFYFVGVFLSDLNNWVSAMCLDGPPCWVGGAC